MQREKPLISKEKKHDFQKAKKCESGGLKWENSSVRVVKKKVRLHLLNSKENTPQEANKSLQTM